MHNQRLSGKEGKQHTESGFALLIALSGLLALLVMSFSTSARVHIKVAENAIANAKAEALADAGLQLGFIDVMSRARSGELGAGTARFCSTPDEDALFISISDEAGRVDLNLAEKDLIRALFSGVGLEASQVLRLTDTILDYRDGDDDRREFGAETADYIAAGTTARPRNGSFDTIEEVRGVLGMGRQQFEAVRPFVTVRSGQTGIDAKVAPDGLVALLSASRQTKSLAFGGGSQQSDATALPIGFRAMSTRDVFLVRATSMTRSGAAAAREAVVRVVPARPKAQMQLQPDPGFGIRARSRMPIEGTRRFVLDVSEWRSTSARTAERQLLSASLGLPKC